MRFLVLGPLEVVDDERRVATGGPRQRLVLALLVADANRVVHVDELIDGVWSDHLPGRPRKTLQVYIANLRHALGPHHGIETTSGGGYRLRAGVDDVDASAFERLVRSARRRAPSHPGAAIAEYRRAESLWRGQPYADLAGCSALAATVVALRERRATAIEERIGLEITTGRATDVVGELEALVLRHPLRERAWASLMHALYAAGRQGDALATFQRARRVLIDEVGAEPGPDLVSMERRILDHDPELGPGRGGGPARTGRVAAPARRARERPVPAALLPRPDPAHGATYRRATVLSCGPAGVEQLTAVFDPGQIADLLDRFGRAVARTVGDHGGLVVASAPSIVTAYFGLPSGGAGAALDAVVAALATLAAVAALQVEGPTMPGVWGARVGLDSGLVATDDGAPPRGRAPRPPAAGHVAVLADRLRAVARPNQVLITRRTAVLVRGRVALDAPTDRRAGGGDGPVVGLAVDDT